MLWRFRSIVICLVPSQIGYLGVCGYPMRQYFAWCIFVFFLLTALETLFRPICSAFKVKYLDY